MKNSWKNKSHKKLSKEEVQPENKRQTGEGRRWEALGKKKKKKGKWVEVRNKEGWFEIGGNETSEKTEERGALNPRVFVKE